jgi:thiol-disulfide isomerase/thioredoxin/mono/diheme cytochrome c family protein
MFRSPCLHHVAVATGCLLLLHGGAIAADPEVKIGSKVTGLKFKDIRYLPRSLDEFKDKKAFVLVFTTTGCPLAEKYLAVLQRLENEFRPKGVQFVAVNAGADDSILAMATQAVEHETEFPFVKDCDGSCATKLGVTRTPTVVILSDKYTLLYRGRIDDQYRLSGNRKEPTREDLREALKEVLAGKEVSVAETEVDGCLISGPAPAKPKKDITYSEHIAPLLQKNCVECHRTGAVAPFGLESYKQVAARADTIAEVVAEGRMPPWFASPKYGHFVNQRGLTVEERELIGAWVRAGCAAGDESKVKVPSVDKKDTWLIGKPDLIVKDLLTYTVPKEGDVPYKYVILPHIFDEDTWVQAVQILPDNLRVVHHCNLAFISAKEKFKMENFITGYVPGGEPMKLEEGVAVCIPADSVLALQIHLVTTGKEEKCKLAVGLKYANGTVQKRLRFHLLADYKFAIPPGAPAHAVKGSKVLEDDAIGVGMFAHMHLRGRDMTFRALNGEDKSETLLMIPNYNFNWQMAYRWEYGKQRFAKGTRIECLAHFDNSLFNPFNPDPKATIRNGDQTHDEMMNGFFFYVREGEKLGLDVDGSTGHIKSK